MNTKTILKLLISEPTTFDHFQLPAHEIPALFEFCLSDLLTIVHRLTIDFLTRAQQLRPFGHKTWAEKWGLLCCCAPISGGSWVSI